MNHYRTRAPARKTPRCPKCGQLAQETVTQFGIRCQCCDLWSWDRFPLVDAETHAARKEAHRVFDQLWKDGTLTRTEAYTLLCRAMGLPRKRCHMKHMNAATAKRVPGAVLEVRVMLARNCRLKHRSD